MHRRIWNWSSTSWNTIQLFSIEISHINSSSEWLYWSCSSFFQMRHFHKNRNLRKSDRIIFILEKNIENSNLRQQHPYSLLILQELYAHIYFFFANLHWIIKRYIILYSIHQRDVSSCRVLSPPTNGPFLEVRWYHFENFLINPDSI